MKKYIVLFSLLAVAACNDNHPSPKQETPVVAVPPVATPVSTPVPAPMPTLSAKPAVRVELEIASVGDTMTFDKKVLTVPSGAEVHLVFKNNSGMTTMQHNWALVKPGTEASVAERGLNCSGRGEVRCPGGKNFVDPSDKDLLAFTAQAPAHQKTEVIFIAPEAGEYPYICTFPGHYIMMKGVLVVKPN